ncbi:hypothetical protein BRC81_02980 [Halobacteriales archaeon QS_1_68_20]|nr:MAG: hypothetical protein BRC81_02980 [Halobacteriales archaeon QS_1_68_20]
MSTDVGYCEREDVKRALQEAELSGALGQEPAIVDDAIRAISAWLRRRTRRHWYDSGGSGTLVGASARSVSTQRLDVPSSPHRQDRQLHRDAQGVRYPVTHAGPYARIQLPHYDVQSLTTLEVRDRGGGVTDWTAASDKVEGRGEDYYLLTEGDEFRTSYLYLRATSIGARVDFDDLLTVGYDYGTDAQSTAWDSVRHAVANLAGADLAVDDDVKTAIPNDGQLIAVETRADRMINRALRVLGDYFETPVA